MRRQHGRQDTMTMTMTIAPSTYTTRHVEHTTTRRPTHVPSAYLSPHEHPELTHSDYNEILRLELCRVIERVPPLGGRGNYKRYRVTGR